jgi:hypothetical protein
MISVKQRVIKSTLMCVVNLHCRSKHDQSLRRIKHKGVLCDGCDNVDSFFARIDRITDVLTCSEHIWNTVQVPNFS